MPKRSLKTRVPVSTAGHRSPEKESHPRPELAERGNKIGFNARHEARLVASLVDYYGWTLCTDGNLYNPNGKSLAERSLAA